MKVPLSPIYLHSDLWGRKTTTDFDNLVISINGTTKASSYDGNDIGAGKIFKQSYTPTNQSNSFITHNNTTQTQDTWSPTKKFRVYEGDVVRVNIKIRNRFNIDKGMLVVSVRDEKGNPAYPLNDPNYWWFAERAKDISVGGKWETISLNVTIKENYDAKELYVDVSTWVLGDKTIDFDELEVIIDRPVKRIAGKRQYELSNHLGNVLATISDRKIGIDVNSDGLADFYDAETISLHDYYPFGMQISARSYQSQEYKYGFNGMEKDDEMKGEGNSYDFGARIYDSRLGRFLSLDPRMADFPFMSPYCFAANSPILFIDENGEFPFATIFMGAAVGTLVGAGSVIVKSLIKKEKIDYRKVILGATKGMLTGALVGSGCITCAGFGGAVIEGTADYIEQKDFGNKPNNKINYKTLISKSIIAGAFSAFGASITGIEIAAQNAGVTIASHNLLKAFLFKNDMIKEAVSIAVDIATESESAPESAPTPEIQNNNTPKYIGQAGAYKKSSGAQYVQNLLKQNDIPSIIIKENGLHKVMIRESDVEKAKIVKSEVPTDLSKSYTKPIQ